jgi:hypothetical protein
VGLLDRSTFYGMSPIDSSLGPIDPRTGLPIQPAARPAMALPPGATLMQPQAPQPPQPMRPAQPSPPPQPNPSAFANFDGIDMNGQDPNVLPPLVAAQPQTEPAPIQPQPGDVAAGTGSAQKKGGFLSRIGDAFGGITSDRQDGFNRSDLLQMGLSLMGNARNGGDWGAVGQDLSRINQGVTNRQDRAREIKRQEVSDAQKAEQFRAWQEQQALDKQQTEDWHAAITAEPDQQKRAELLAMGKDKYAEVKLAEQRLKAEEAQRAAAFANQKTLQDEEIAARAREGALDREERLKAADIAKRDPSATVRGRADQARIAPWIDAANVAQIYTIPRMDRMREIMNQLAARNGINKPLDAETRITLKRLTGTDPETQGLLQEFNGLVSQFSRDEAQKLKPVSNLDIESIEKNMPGADTPLSAGLRMLDRMEAELNRGIARTNNMVEWMDQGYSLTQPNKDGKTFLQVYGEAPPDASAPINSTPAPVASPSSATSIPSPQVPSKPFKKMGGGSAGNPNAIAKVAEDLAKPGVDRQEIYRELLKDFEEPTALQIMREAQNRAARRQQIELPAAAYGLF